MLSTDPGVWLGVFLIASFFTILYKENILFQIAQFTILGAGVAHGLNWAIQRYRDYVFTPLQEPNPDYMLILITVLGLSCLLTLSRKYGWLGRYYTAFTLGIGLGVTGGSTINSMVQSQIVATIQGLAATDPLELLNAWIILITVIVITIYFIFTIKSEALGGSVGWVMRIGRLLLMVTMGASAAPFLQGDISYTLAPLQTVIYTWLGRA